MTTVKITSGNLRGRDVETPDSDLTHPMGSREKLALFNMVSLEIINARVLDAFAGSGALGIEAISRGAKEVIFVEKNPRAAQIIRENLAKLNLRARVASSDVANFTDEQGFDVILADPPYDNFKIEPILKLVELLKRGGTLILSHPGDAPKIESLKLLKTKSYAAAHISVYVK